MTAEALVMTCAADDIVDLRDARDGARFGGKAAALAWALGVGQRVPAGFVIAAGAAADASLAARIEARVAALGEGPFAVRSSGIGEDGRQHSFAGQLETRLAVPAAEVMAAIEACWAAARALHVFCYGAELGGVAVIVQRMVAADAAGVAFSADPQTGEREVVLVEAVPSLADQLVSGAESPETWRITGDDCRRIRARAAAVLAPADAQRVADLAASLAAQRGLPQDVEWALADGALWLLQTRPITALPAAPVAIVDEPPAGSWDRDDHHGVLSPLGWAWFQAYPKAMAEAFRLSGAPIERVEITRIGGHLYQRMVMEGSESATLPPRFVLWLAARLAPSLRRANRTAEAFFDEERFMQPLTDWEAGGRDALRRNLAALFVADPEGLSDDALLARIDEALALCHEGLHQHAFLHAPGIFGIGKLAIFLADELGWPYSRALDLVAGSSSATLALHDELEAIVAEHRADSGGADELAPRLAAWLEDNRLRMLHYDPKHPTLGERPGLVRAIVANILRAQPTAERPRSRAADLLAEAAASLPAEKATELKRLVAIASAGYAVREGNAIDAVSRPAGLLRHFVLELGRRIEPAIGDRTHAVYLYPEEHGPALRGELDGIGELVARRRGEESWALQHRGPKHVGPPSPPPPPPDVFPRGMRCLMRVIGWLEEAEALPEPGEGDVLQGIGIGGREVIGRARVVHRPEQMTELLPDEIIVCRITSPEWAVGLGRIGAIITDEGGMLSHPAIVARELGVPAVVGTTVATQRIATGDRIRVDPVAATVSVVS